MPENLLNRRTVVAGAAALAGTAACQTSSRAMKPPEVAVIGAGAAGSSTAFALARAGARVTLYDQFALGHARGSSHGASRLFRTAYFEHPNYVPILQRALKMWLALDEATGERVFYREGVLEAGPPDGGFMRGLRVAIDEHHLPVPQLSAAELKRDHPAFTIPAGYEAYFEADAGFVLAGKAVARYLRLAREDGVTMRAETPVTGWAPAGDGVHVRTASDAKRYDRLVIAAGSWADDLLALPLAKVRPWPRTLFWRRPDTDRFGVGGAFKPFGVETSDGRFFYGFPAIDAAGVKVAEHTGGHAIARPEDRGDNPEAGESEAIDAFLRDFIPALAGRPGSFERCLYEMSADENFIIDRHPASDRVVFAAGLSGHGFKFAPVLVETLAIMALEDRTPAEWEFLSMKRFG